MHTTDTPSTWVTRHAHLIAPGGTVLDVAGGWGRHARWLAARGHPVTLLDRDAQALAHSASTPGIRTVCADIEGGPWPLTGQTYAAVLVTHYLWRARMPDILASVAPGGVLIYETFAAGNESVGRPSRPDFLLRPGELLQVCQGLRVVAYEDGFLPDPARFIQRVVAVREDPGLSGAAPARHLLPDPRLDRIGG